MYIRDFQRKPTGKESQEEETNACDLFVHVTVRILLDIQLVYDRYLDLFHFVM